MSNAPSKHQRRLLENELQELKPTFAKSRVGAASAASVDPFTALVIEVATGLGYSKAAVDTLARNLPKVIADVRGVPARHQKTLLKAELEELKTSFEREVDGRTAAIEN